MSAPGPTWEEDSKSSFWISAPQMRQDEENLVCKPCKDSGVYSSLLQIQFHILAALQWAMCNVQNLSHFGLWSCVTKVLGTTGSGSASQYKPLTCLLGWQLSTSGLDFCVSLGCILSHLKSVCVIHYEHQQLCGITRELLQCTIQTENLHNKIYIYTTILQ